jgi:hypothetical protein
VIRDRSFVLNRKNEVLCFVRVAKFGFREKGSFVLNRNWQFWGRAVRGRVAVSARGCAPDRRLVLFDIFTDSSSSCGVRNAKRCVWTGLLPGEGRCYGCKTNVKDALLKGKSRRPLHNSTAKETAGRWRY